MALDLGDEKIKYIMDVLQKSMINLKPAVEMNDFGFVEDTYRLLDELLIIRHFLHKPKDPEPETITENLKNENARLSKLVNVLEEHIKVLKTQLRLQRELASQKERDFLIRQNTISQMNSFSKETELK